MGGTEQERSLVQGPVPLVTVAIIFLLACTLQAAFGYYFWGQSASSYGNDDAFISYRYARNLVEHGVLTFNLSDAPPVEGFSNALFVALAAAIIWLFGDAAVYPVMAVLGVAATLSAILLTSRYLSRVTDPVCGALGAVVLALLPAYWVHASSGLETSLVFLIQVMLWIAVARRVEDDRDDLPGLVGLCTFCILLVALRTDGFLTPVLVAGWLFVLGRPRDAAAILAVTAGVFLLLMAARLAYYGLPLPLTTYAKVSGDLVPRLETAARYYGSIVLKGGLLIPLLAMLALAFKALRAFGGGLSGLRRQLPLHLWLFGGVSTYYFAIGGDIYRDRFLLILFATGTVATLSLARRIGRSMAIGVAAAMVLHQTISAIVWDPRFDFIAEWPKYDRAVALGKYLAEQHGGALLATGTAGKIPYYSRLQTIDMLGLNDRHIAMSDARGSNPGHSKWDVDYVLSRQPDIICTHVFRGGNMTYGLKRRRYEEEGYHLTYLVRNRGVPGVPVRSVAHMDDRAISSLLNSGYRFGCVMRSKAIK